MAASNNSKPETREELIKWLDGFDIKAVVATHFHADCLGGLGAFHEKKIPSYALNKTIQLATQHKANHIPKNGWTLRGRAIGP